ncbi:MAG: DUF3429 family protein [Pseudomonadales bacterium]
MKSRGVLVSRERVVPGLAYLGSLPFLALMTGYQATNAGWMLEVFQCYGLAISCFLLGSWWGIALAKTPKPTLPMTELLISNGLLLLLIGVQGFLSDALLVTFQGVFLVVIWWVETKLSRFRRAPAYYLLMRRRVTGWVALLHLGFAGMLVSAI